MRGLILGLALFAAPVSAIAGGSASLTLADAAGVKDKAIVDGAAWLCAGADCIARNVKSQPPLRACQRVVAKVGAVSAFTWKGKAFSADELAACNGERASDALAAKPAEKLLAADQR